MANYEATARSNYFKVKDTDAFLAFCADNGVNHWRYDEVYHKNPGERYAVSPHDGCEGFDELDTLAEGIAKHLQEDQVCILMEVGHEKLRYMSAFAVAVNAKGEIKQIILGDLIIETAKKMTDKPDEITQPEY